MIVLICIVVLWCISGIAALLYAETRLYDVNTETLFLCIIVGACLGPFTLTLLVPTQPKRKSKIWFKKRG